MIVSVGYASRTLTGLAVCTAHAARWSLASRQNDQGREGPHGGRTGVWPRVISTKRLRQRAARVSAEQGRPLESVSGRNGTGGRLAGRATARSRTVRIGHRVMKAGEWQERHIWGRVGTVLDAAVGWPFR